MSVLIVGAGPAGLATAVTLARYGVPVRLVERRSQPSNLPRATVLSTRTMELLRSWGLDEAVRAAGFDVVWRAYRCRTLTDPDGQVVDVGYPTAEEAARHSPTAPYGVPQDELEPLLLAHLRGYRNVRISLGTELVALRDTGHGVSAELRDGSTGRVRTHRAHYLVAADGAHSAIRPLLGIRTTGTPRLHDSLSILFEAPLWPVVGERRYGIYPIVDPAAPGALVPAGGDRWIHGIEYDPVTGIPSESRLISGVRTATGVPDLPVRILRTARFGFAVQVADSFRAGNSFLAGDAAHRLTPRGGTGLNTALQDGYELGWRLAWALKGWGDLLDGYEERRRPVAEHNAERSARPDGSYLTASQGLAIDLDGRVPHAWVAAGVSTVDLVGPGLTLFTGPSGSGRTPHTGPVPLTVHRLDAATARAIGAPLLVGPGGHDVSREAALLAA